MKIGMLAVDLAKGSCQVCRVGPDGRLANELEDASKTDDELRRLCTVPGVGPV